MQKQKLQTYRLPVYYEMYGEVTVRAKSLKHAIKKAEDGELPKHPEYITDSFHVDTGREYRTPRHVPCPTHAGKNG